MNLKLEELPPQIRSILIMMLKAALSFRDLEQNEDEWIMFSKEIWKTMTMNNIDTLNAALVSAMANDIKNYLDEESDNKSS